jgi:hypothetical protein
MSSSLVAEFDFGYAYAECRQRLWRVIHDGWLRPPTHETASRRGEG